MSTNHTPEEARLQTPIEWCNELHVTILDPDGWRDGTRAWAEPITEAEFLDRMVVSTVLSVSREHFDRIAALRNRDGAGS